MPKVIKPNDRFIESLTALPLFQCLTPQQRKVLVDCATVIYCEPGEFLFREGDRAEGFFILKSGRTKMRRISSSGKEIVLHLSSPPQMIGCKALTAPGTTYPADAVAVDAVIALGFKRENFLDKVAHVPGVFFSLLVEFNHRLSEIYTLQSNLLEPIEKRIANLLLNQAHPNPDDPDMSDLRPIHLTKSLIASIVGTTTETAIRILSRWRKMGLIQSERGKITVTNSEGICRIAEWNPEKAHMQDITLGFTV
jgi:CRP/FNR family transcriptional regulator